VEFDDEKIIERNAECGTSQLPNMRRGGHQDKREDGRGHKERSAPADVPGPEDEKNLYRILVFALASAVRERGDGSGVSMAVKVGRSARARRGYMCWCKK
jgi:hypothetical protein